MFSEGLSASVEASFVNVETMINDRIALCQPGVREVGSDSEKRGEKLKASSSPSRGRASKSAKCRSSQVKVKNKFRKGVLSLPGCSLRLWTEVRSLGWWRC